MVMRSIYLMIMLITFMQSAGQECVGGQIHTNDTFLYGRFEVAMRSVQGEGIVSSFFLYNLEVGCNWPEENNEIDIEMTGNTETLYFTTHYPGPWYYTDEYNPDFNPHDSIQEYAIEWEPGIVRWFVNEVLVNVQDQSFVADLIYPQNIVMNLYSAEVESWVGTWDPQIMPVESEYDYVRYFEYTPGNGNYGTNNNFSFTWEDEFNFYNEDLWQIEEHGGFGGNFCTFKPSSVEFSDGKLILQLEEENPNPIQVPVTFSVDLSNQEIEPTDIIYLNGTFNDWCGTCEPMVNMGNIWSKTIFLDPGEYEYLFTKNLWEENGGAPLGSECDYAPCDEYVNYGLVVNENSDPINVSPVCWGECLPCEVTGIDHLESSSEKDLINVYDVLGRPSEMREHQLLFFKYSDGTIEKKYIFQE